MQTSLLLTFLVLQDVWSKAPFITHIGGILTIFLLDDIFEVVVDLGSDAHGLFEGACPNRQDHELLHGKLVARMRASVDHIEGLVKVRGERGVMSK